jgi:hypothetical protein
MRLPRLLRAAAVAALALAPFSGCSSIDTRFVQASSTTINGALAIGAGAYVATAVVNAFPDSRGVMIASHPQGARVLIDGRDSGFSTPCCLALDERKQRIDLVLDGYQTATRIVDDDNRTYLIYWDEGYIGPKCYHFPMFLNLYDGLVPVRFEETYAPERLFVRMRSSVMP